MENNKPDTRRTNVDQLIRTFVEEVKIGRFVAWAMHALYKKKCKSGRMGGNVVEAMTYRQASLRLSMTQQEYLNEIV